MALLFIDGFDHYATSDITRKWSATASSGAGASVAVSSSAFRTGVNGLRVTQGSAVMTGYVNKTLSPSGAVCIVGFAFKVSARPPVACPILTIFDGATAQVTLRLNSTGTLTVTRGNSAGTVLGSGSTILNTGQFYFVELKVTINNATGTVDLHVDNGTEISLTGQNTRASAANQWSVVAVGVADSASTNNTNGATYDFDDVYICDGSGSPNNTLLGDCRVDARTVTGAGANTGWTPSAGSNFQNVDDATPNDDTDYNSALTTTLKDTFAVQDAAVVGANILGVQVNVLARKVDSGLASIVPVVRHSGTDNDGNTISPATTYAFGIQMYEVNPGTAAAWTEANFNAAEFGYKKTA